MNSLWHLKFGDYMKKGNIKKTKGATSNNSSETSDDDYVDRWTTRAVTKQVKQTLMPN
jgi:hypothetical protein